MVPEMSASLRSICEEEEEEEKEDDTSPVAWKTCLINCRDNCKPSFLGEQEISNCLCLYPLEEEEEEEEEERQVDLTQKRNEGVKEVERIEGGAQWLIGREFGRGEWQETWWASTSSTTP